MTLSWGESTKSCRNGRRSGLDFFVGSTVASLLQCSQNKVYGSLPQTRLRHSSSPTTSLCVCGSPGKQLGCLPWSYPYFTVVQLPLPECTKPVWGALWSTHHQCGMVLPCMFSGPSMHCRGNVRECSPTSPWSLCNSTVTLLACPSYTRQLMGNVPPLWATPSSNMAFINPLDRCVVLHRIIPSL